MTMMMMLLLSWLVFIVAFVIGWSRLRAQERALEGIDENAYINGRTQIVARPMRPSPRRRIAHGRRLTLSA
jgi:hypothetical protein